MINKNFTLFSATKSPYDQFLGNSSYIITILGAQQVGKSAICQQLKLSCEDIQNRKLFRNIAVKPDFQLSFHSEAQKIDLGIYDSLGFIFQYFNLKILLVSMILNY